MVRVRMQEEARRGNRPARPTPPKRAETSVYNAKATPTSGFRGLSERQWFISLLVISGLLLLITFRGCILPSGVGPKQKPASQTTATPAPSQAPQVATEYTVKSGDTPSGIAQQTGVTVDALLQANGLTRQSILRVGQKLKIPSAT